MSDGPKIRATARLQVTLEVEAPGVYGAEWELKSLLQQAEREALATLARELIAPCPVRLLSKGPMTVTLTVEA